MYLFSLTLVVIMIHVYTFQVFSKQRRRMGFNIGSNSQQSGGMTTVHRQISTSGGMCEAEDFVGMVFYQTL